MAGVLSPRASAQLIYNAGKHTDISTEGVDKLSADLIDKLKNNKDYIHFKGWKTHPLNPSICDENAIDWIFLVDALNFSFWSNTGEVKYAVKGYTGYWSLCAAINRALDQGVPVTSAEFYRNITIDQARQIFASDNATEIPMLSERTDVMREVGQILVEKFDGKFFNCVKKADGSAKKLLQLVVDNFPCFKDEATFRGHRVSFYKRAQILVADLWACFEGKGIGDFSDIDDITMFADYRIPQTLVYFGVLSYSAELMGKLEESHMFETGDEMEMEIRAASIWAVELLANRMNELISRDQTMRGVHINSILLDHFLWDYRRKHNEETKHIPFHKIRCIYY